MNRFYLRTKRSPTYYNLAKYLQEINWRAVPLSFLSQFSEKNLNYELEITTQLEFKHLLASLVQEYCSEVMPKTSCINDNNWQNVLDTLPQDKIWILKPALLNNGKNILIFDNVEDIKLHYMSSNRMGGDHVLQEYIATPHLLKGPKGEGHKYSIRMFMVLTNYDGAFIYPNGYFNIAVSPYCPENFYDLSCHITNEHLQEDRVNVIQIPTFKYDLFKPLFPKIKNSLSQVISGLKNKYPNIFLNSNQPRKLALFGMDFIIDEAQGVWLIEANHGPCFPIEPEHDLQISLYQGFWREVVKNFVQPIGQKTQVEQLSYNMFEKLL